MRLEILNPQAQTAEETVKAAPRSADLCGKRIGLYWNMKAGGDHALSSAADVLAARYPNTTFKRYGGEVGGAAGRSMYFYGAHEMITKAIDPR